MSYLSCGAAFGVLLALSGCPADKDNGGDPTGADTSASGGSTGDDTGGVTDGQGATSEPETSYNPVTSTGGDTGTTGGLASSSASEGGETTSGPPDGAVLDSCVIDDPCPWTNIDSCDLTCDDPAMQCMWPLLRDGAQFRMRWGAPNSLEDSWKGWFALGDAGRTVLTTWREDPQDAPVERCTLAEPAFFTDCIDHPEQESCFLPGNWITDCVAEPAPSCPAP